MVMINRQIHSSRQSYNTNLARDGFSIEVEIMSFFPSILSTDLCSLTCLLAIELYVDVNALTKTETEETLQQTETWNSRLQNC